MFIYGLLVLLLAACYQDYRKNKIRNWLMVAGLCWGLFLQISEKEFVGVFDFAEGLLGVFLITYPFFKLGMLGAGDVKLFAVCAGALGLKRGMIFLCCTFLLAAVAASIKMFCYHNFLQRFRYFFNYVGQAVRTARLSLYERVGQGDADGEKSRIHLAGPACLSILLSLGGFY